MFMKKILSKNLYCNSEIYLKYFLIIFLCISTTPLSAEDPFDQHHRSMLLAIKKGNTGKFYALLKSPYILKENYIIYAKKIISFSRDPNLDFFKTLVYDGLDVTETGGGNTLIYQITASYLHYGSFNSYDIMDLIMERGGEPQQDPNHAFTILTPKCNGNETRYPGIRERAVEVLDLFLAHCEGRKKQCRHTSTSARESFINSSALRQNTPECRKMQERFRTRQFLPL